MMGRPSLTERLDAFDIHIEELLPAWSMAPVAAAYQALRGVSRIVAATFAVEVGDVRRFENPRQLMAFLSLVPSERSTGDTIRRGGLTLAGNRRAQRVLVDGACSYRQPDRPGADRSASVSAGGLGQG
jgi:transposase